MNFAGDLHRSAYEPVGRSRCETEGARLSSGTIGYEDVRVDPAGTSGRDLGPTLRGGLERETSSGKEA